MDIFAPTADQLPLVAELLTSGQAAPATHLGFLAPQAAQNLDSFAEFSDPPATTFRVAMLEDRPIGALGVERDLEQNRGFIWGPVALEQWDATVAALWAELAPLASGLDKIDAFCNIANERTARWYAAQGWPKHGEEAIIEFRRAQLADLPASPVTPLAPEQHASFVALHDATFPNTYYSGATILERCNAERTVLVVGTGAEVQGYTYVEAEPEYGEGCLEFVGVAPSARGQGVGRQLVTQALHWLFQWPSIHVIELVVNQNNSAARGLYASAGFRDLHHMVHFRWERQPAE